MERHGREPAHSFFEQLYIAHRTEGLHTCEIEVFPCSIGKGSFLVIGQIKLAPISIALKKCFVLLLAKDTDFLLKFRFFFNLYKTV